MLTQKTDAVTSHGPQLVYENTMLKAKPMHIYGGGGGGFRVDSETKNYVDAKVETVAAQNNARFSEVLARIDRVSDRIEHLPKAMTFRDFIVGGISLLGVGIGIVLSVLAISADRFDGGLAAGSVKDSILTEQEVRNDAQDEKLNRIIEILTTKPQP